MATKQSKQISCVQCHKRKVRCNKQQPCNNCLRRSETCEWVEGGPPPQTAPDPPQAGPSSAPSPPSLTDRYSSALLQLAASIPTGECDRARSVLASFQVSHDVAGWLTPTSVWQLKTFIDDRGATSAAPGLATSLAFTFACLANAPAHTPDPGELAPRDFAAIITGAAPVKAPPVITAADNDAYIDNAMLCLQLAEGRSESGSETIATLYLLHCCRSKSGAFLARAIQLALRAGLHAGRAFEDETAGSMERIWSGLFYADVLQAHTYNTPRLISDRVLSKRPLPNDPRAHFAQGLASVLDAMDDYGRVPFDLAIRLAQSIEMTVLQLPPELRMSSDLEADFASTTSILQLAITSHTACSQLSLLKPWLLEAIRRQGAGQAQEEITDPGLLATVCSHAARKVILVHLALRRAELRPAWCTLAASGVCLFEAISIIVFCFAANVIDRAGSAEFVLKGLSLIAPLAQSNRGVAAGLDAIDAILKKTHPDCMLTALAGLKLEPGSMPAAMVHPQLDADVLDLLLQAGSNDGGDQLISKILGGPRPSELERVLLQRAAAGMV